MDDDGFQFVPYKNRKYKRNTAKQTKEKAAGYTGQDRANIKPGVIVDKVEKLK